MHSVCRHWDTGNAGGSWNHAWLGSVGSYLYHGVGGISCRDDLQSAACGTIDIRPYPPLLNSPGAVPVRGPHSSSALSPRSDLPYVDVSYNSVRGLVKSSWSYGRNTHNTTFTMSVLFPANVQATVAVPVWVAGSNASQVDVQACKSESVPGGIKMAHSSAFFVASLQMQVDLLSICKASGCILFITSMATATFTSPGQLEVGRPRNAADRQ